MADEKAQLGKLTVFGLGLGATVTVYAVYYLRHPEVVTGHQESYGTLGVVLAGVCLLILAAAGGLWTLANHPTSMKKAFAIGLGCPAVFFAVDLGASGEGAPADPGGPGGTPKSLTARKEPGFLPSLRMVVAPVSSTSAVQKAEAVEARKVAERSLADAETKIETLNTELTTIRTDIRKLSGLDRALRDFGPTLGGPLVGKLGSPDEKDRAAAAGLLSYLEGDLPAEAKTALRQIALRDPSSDARAWAAFALVRRDVDARTGVSVLGNLLDSNREETRETSVVLLGALGTAAKVHLKKLEAIERRDVNPRIRKEAENSRIRIREK